MSFSLINLHLKVYMIPIDPSNPDLLEVFADSFAMAIMHNTELNRYNPFHSLPKDGSVIIN